MKELYLKIKNEYELVHNVRLPVYSFYNIVMVAVAGLIWLMSNTIDRLAIDVDLLRTTRLEQARRWGSLFGVTGNTVGEVISNIKETLFDIDFTKIEAYRSIGERVNLEIRDSDYAGVFGRVLCFPTAVGVGYAFENATQITLTKFHNRIREEKIIGVHSLVCNGFTLNLDFIARVELEDGANHAQTIERINNAVKLYQDSLVRAHVINRASLYNNIIAVSGVRRLRSYSYYNSANQEGNRRLESVEIPNATFLNIRFVELTTANEGSYTL